MVNRITAILAIIDVLVNWGSQLEMSCNSFSRIFAFFEIHLLKLFIISINMYASMIKNNGSIRVNKVLNIGPIMDNNRVPLSVVKDMSSAIPRGNDMRSKPIYVNFVGLFSNYVILSNLFTSIKYRDFSLTNLSITWRDMSQVNINNIKTTAWVISASRPSVCMIIGHTARYIAGSQLASKPKGLKSRDNSSRNIFCCFQ